MQSKRDKLLIRPWQQRRYENHRRKVQSALPAIDNKSPPTREHISLKLKKQQKETERIAKIEKDNLILLQKLCYIMKTSRVDNYWNTPPPTFLSRVSIYRQQPQPDFGKTEDIVVQKINHIRKNKCSACTPKKSLDSQIPEERIPWEPEKPPVSKKRSRSVPPKKSSTLPSLLANATENLPPKLASTTLANERSKSCKSNQRYHRRVEDYMQSPQSFVLSRGNLKLAVNFPSDTMVKLREGKSERLLLGTDDCYCKALSKVC